MGAFTLQIDSEGIALLTFDLPGQKVNKLSWEALDELNSILNIAQNNPAIKVLVIRSAKEDQFIAGADLKAFEPGFREPSLCEKFIRKGHEVFNRLSSLPFPTIALIDGICLGGGTELALACNYRVVTDNEKTQIGLPEVSLGIFPGWGGTQRLPRLVGIEEALNIILSGKNIDGKKAYKIKFADAIIPKEFIDDYLKKFVLRCLNEGEKKKILSQRKQSGFYQTIMEKNPIGKMVLFKVAKNNILHKTKGLYPAPLLALNLIKKTVNKDLKKGLEEEITTFIGAIGKEFRYADNLIKLFFATEQMKKGPKNFDSVQGKKIKRAAVIGAGTMGAGIAWLFTYKDIPVRFKDVSWETVGKGYESIFAIYKTLLKLRKLKPHQVERKFLKAEGTVDYTGFKSVDIVIEAATENLDLKRKLFAELEGVVNESTIIASNTSSLPISEMSRDMKYPERFLGMHFFNPPDRMPLVEIVPGEKTSPETIATAINLCKEFKKVPLVVKDCPGFLVNRIFARAANEASWMLQEGISIDRLDRVMTEFGMPMGPCRLSDEVGNDIAYKVFGSLYKTYGERMHPPKLGKEMAEAGFLGKKSGKGFYLYDSSKNVINPDAIALINKISEHKVNIDDKEIVDRFIFGMIDEAARCLEEGVVQNPLDVDIGLLYGIGFPPFRFGLLKYADEIGLKKVNERLNEFANKYGERFLPCRHLTQIDSFYGSQKTQEPKKEPQKEELCCV